MSSHQPGEEARLTVELFGPKVNIGFRCEASGQEADASTAALKLRSRKGLWLLALLALRANKAVSRDWVASTLWPDSETARETLRRTLTDLRTALADTSDSLEATNQTLRLRIPESAVDVHRFEAFLKRGSLADLEQAIGLYRGPLLEECQEPWVLADRIRCADSYRDALERLAALHGEQKRYGDAIRVLRLALAADPLRESACRALMETLAANGEPAEAILVYRNFRLLLHRDLNSEPSPQTAALYREIKEGNGAKSAASPNSHGAVAVLGNGSAANGKTAAAAPPASGQSATNLPYPLTGLLGRDEDLRRIVELLQRSRLVTLTGAGGLGKTRLAIEIGHALQQGYADGAWFVELAAIGDPTLVPAAVASVLEIREEPGKSLTDTLTARLRSRSLLLVIDNCEHLIDSCASFVRTLLTACPGVRVVATSRQALRITGEIVRALDPLSVPDRIPSGDMEHGALKDFLSGSAALQLFVERAEAVQPSFRLCSGNLPATVEVCRRLDGVPLALELAAARVASLPVEQVALLLGNRFQLLTGGDRTAEPRQQSLRALVDWSYDLLHPREQDFFRRLSLFAGGWTVEAALAVCDPDSASVLEEAGQAADLNLTALSEKIAARLWDVQNMLDALVARSLVLAEQDAHGEVRYRMLETLREYAAARREALDTQGEAVRRYILWYRCFADAAYRERGGANQARALRLVDQDHDNFRQALQTAGPGPERMRLAAALYWYWYIHGHYSEGRAWCRRALDECPSAPDALRARLLKSLGDFSWAQGDMDAARSIHLQNLELQKVVQDRRMIAVTLNSLGLVSYHQGDCAAASEFYRQSAGIMHELGERQLEATILANGALPLKDMGDYQGAIAMLREAETVVRELGDSRGLGQVLHTLCLIETRLGNYDTARKYLEESLTAERDTQDAQGEATGICTMGDIALLQEDFDCAERCFLKALETFRRLGAKRSIAAATCSLAEVALARGDLDLAGTHLRQSLGIEIELDNRRGIVDCLRGIARRELAASRAENAAYLWAAADAEKERLGLSVPPNVEEQHRTVGAALREALGERFSAIWNDGRAADLHHAAERARG